MNAPTEPHPLEAIEHSDIRTVPTSAGDLIVGPHTIGQRPAFVRALKRCGDVIIALVDNTPLDDAIAIIDARADEFIGFCSAATGIPTARIGALSGPEFYRLLAAVIGVNRDFLTRQPGPDVLALVALDPGLSAGTA